MTKNSHTQMALHRNEKNLVFCKEHFDRPELGKFKNMMSKKDRRIFSAFAARVHQRFPNARIWAFGSRARGKTSWDSDFDICIVMDHVDRNIDRWIRDVAWEVSFENGCVITTIVFDAYQFENGPMSESTLVANIIYEGIAA